MCETSPLYLTSYNSTIPEVLHCIAKFTLLVVDQKLLQLLGWRRSHPVLQIKDLQPLHLKLEVEMIGWLT